MLEQVALEVPGWMRMVPLGAIERIGSGVMQRVLDSMVLFMAIDGHPLWS